MISTTPDDLTAATLDALGNLDPYAHQCHGASIALVQLGALGPSRVARGSCKGVGGQHSWVVLGDDCYARDATIVDPTLWSYDDEVEGIWVGSASDGRHTPHGSGSIWQWGRPERAAWEDAISLHPVPPRELSVEAQSFLETLGPIDYQGWCVLANAPVEGWPAREIMEAMLDTPYQMGKHTSSLGGHIPIDIVGMLTDRNPGGAYLPGGE